MSQVDFKHQSTEQWLSRLHCLGVEHELPAWTARGVQHGFEGLGFELPEGGYSLKQVHGRQLVEVRSGMDSAQLPEGDGLWTSEPGLILAVKTADCLPILLSHPQLVMAIHAGWKGLAQDILGAALELLKSRRLAIRDCHIAIGPSISLDSFEVGPELIQQFRSQAFGLDDELLAWSASKGQADRWHLDLGTLAALRLQRAGFAAEQITLLRTCTKKNPLLWHSFRRDAQRAGRNWSWIAR